MGLAWSVILLNPNPIESSPSAYSRTLFGNDEMRFIGSSIVGTHTLGQVFGSQQAVGLDHVALAVNPFGLNGVEPGALRRQQTWQDTHALPCLFDLPVVLTNPGANRLTLVPGSIIPDQEPVRFAALEQSLAAPVQELRSDRAHWSSADKTQPHLLTSGLLWCPLLPQYPIAGERFGIRVSFFPGLFDEADGMLSVLPGRHAR